MTNEFFTIFPTATQHSNMQEVSTLRESIEVNKLLTSTVGYFPKTHIHIMPLSRNFEIIDITINISGVSGSRINHESSLNIQNKVFKIGIIPGINNFATKKDAYEDLVSIFGNLTWGSHTGNMTYPSNTDGIFAQVTGTNDEDSDADHLILPSRPIFRRYGNLENLVRAKSAALPEEYYDDLWLGMTIDKIDDASPSPALNENLHCIIEVQAVRPTTLQRNTSGSSRYFNIVT